VQIIYLIIVCPTRCKVDKVENEWTSHNFSLFAIFLPKVIEVGRNLTKF